MRYLIATLLLICITLTLHSAPQSPCLKDQNYAQFDFWLGHWRVTDSKGTVQGTNKIEKTADGCMIKEHWTSASGNHGFSMNYYNPRTEKWTQNWVSGGSIINYSGELVEKSMVLTGVIYYQSQDTTAKFRGKWTLLEDGRVRQFFEQYNTENDTWTVWFEGFYSKMKSNVE